MLLGIPAFAVAQTPAPPTKETFASDIKPGALWDGREKVPFKAMDYPKMAKASEVDFLDDEDYVLGFSQGGQARAYPLRYAWWHHIINDKFKQEDGTEAFVTVTY
jgi:hypothetical protein